MKQLITILLIIGTNFSQAQKVTAKENLAVPVLTFDSAGKLKITPSATSSKKDFDFFAGKWRLFNRMLKKKPDGSTEWKQFKSTQEMHIILRGTGNIDNFLADYDGKPYEGMTLRLFNPETRLWSIYWADSKYGVLGLPPVVGSFENRVGHFFSQDIINDKNVITVYRWDARNPTNPVWSQGLSEDNGKTWEWNWFMYMNKIK